MRYKKRIFSAIALTAVMALITGSIVSRADNTGYTGGEVSAIANLNVESHGTFRYGAGEGQEDVVISSNDINNLADAIRELSTQVVTLGDTTKGVDDEIKEDIETINANLVTFSNNLSTYLSKTEASNTYLSKTDASSTYATKASIPSVPSLSNYYTKDQTYSKSEVDNKVQSLSGGSSGSSSTLTTSFGTANLNTRAVYTVDQLIQLFPPRTQQGSTSYGVLVFGDVSPTASNCLGHFYGTDYGVTNSRHYQIWYANRNSLPNSNISNIIRATTYSDFNKKFAICNVV